FLPVNRDLGLGGLCEGGPFGVCHAPASLSGGSLTGPSLRSEPFASGLRKLFTRPSHRPEILVAFENSERFVKRHRDDLHCFGPVSGLRNTLDLLQDFQKTSSSIG